MTVRMTDYISTRGQAPALGFADVVLAGLAADGGLYVPQSLPQFTPQQITAFAALDYPALAKEIITRFTTGSISQEDLHRIIDESYAAFRHSATAPLTQLAAGDWMLELFHGPTLAFKDFALQFLGRLMDHILTERGQRLTIVGATSGDTGSAAIAGCRRREHMDIFILHPHERVSEVQRRQMTTVSDANVHNIAIAGTFDDCQHIVKTLFNDTEFREKQNLGAVNSINWARIMAQIVYYFYAALALGSPARSVSFSVPTGNFGDIYAGFLAHKMGLPLDKLVIATNRNDILARTLKSGSYVADGVVPTISPSMDIQVSSNFERLLFDLYDHDGAAVRRLMEDYRNEHSFTIDSPQLLDMRRYFSAGSLDDSGTKNTIREIYENTGRLVDPHTAVGVAVGRSCHDNPDIPLITLATAHPAKFPAAVEEATGIHPELPEHMADLFAREERFDVLPNDPQAVEEYIGKHA